CVRGVLRSPRALSPVGVQPRITRSACKSFLKNFCRRLDVRSTAPASCRCILCRGAAELEDGSFHVRGPDKIDKRTCWSTLHHQAGPCHFRSSHLQPVVVTVKGRREPSQSGTFRPPRSTRHSSRACSRRPGSRPFAAKSCSISRDMARP